MCRRYIRSILRNIFRIIHIITETISAEHKRVKNYENLLLRRIEMYFKQNARMNK